MLTGAAFLLGFFALLFVMISSLRTFFGKYSGRLMFAMWLIGVLAAYFVFLFQNGKYPMGIDLAGGAELIYRLDYTQTNLNIEKVEATLKKEMAKDPASAEVRKLRQQLDTLIQSKNTAPDKATE